MEKSSTHVFETKAGGRVEVVVDDEGRVLVTGSSNVRVYLPVSIDSVGWPQIVSTNDEAAVENGLVIRTEVDLSGKNIRVGIDRLLERRFYGIAFQPGFKVMLIPVRDDGSIGGDNFRFIVLSQKGGTHEETLLDDRPFELEKVVLPDR